MLIVGLIMALLAVVSAASQMTGDMAAGVKIGAAVDAIGLVIYGLMIAGVGSSTRKGEISQKIDILSKYVYVVGAGVLVKGIFTGAGKIIAGNGILAAALGVVFSIIVAFIIMWVAKKITDGQVSTMDRIIWIILAVVFVLCILGALASIVGSLLAIAASVSFITLLISSICNLVIFVFLTIAILDGEVKKAMGM